MGYYRVRNVTKNFTFPRQFQPFQPENLYFMVFLEVKRGTFPAENLPSTFAFPPQILPFPDGCEGKYATTHS